METMNYDEIVATKMAEPNAGAWIGDGWKPLIERANREIELEGGEYEILQIKEKFGTLRFYIRVISGDEQYINQMARMAETASFFVCENCGTLDGVETGSPPGWIRTLCQSCGKMKDEKGRAMNI
jgi:hypothetical protein